MLAGDHDFVNYEAIRSMSDEELERTLEEDAMPSDLFNALKVEYNKRVSEAARGGE